ncbi:TPR-like protein [Xylona heveae TC161]|uniref:TPR-like protein n=1 Tax=Xylona heveae (strain CBS 132557 / TC161) TaxID=1328760 RepID=A0A165G1Y1_XYLHT|nr:TPR-like protein [Xylona heveae TC161]KZF21645.1 TPR-like protein [Xylona heveae TC161]
MQALGGQGKTQIALEYCRKNKGCYRGIFWVDATSEASAERSFETIATEINKPVTRTFDDMPSTIRFVLETIESWEEQWLVVYDNYDRPDLYDLRKYIPRTGHGAIIVTSRAEGTGILGELIRVPSMLHDGGVELLLRRMSADEVKKNTPVGLQIVTRLGGLALAIDQAAAYIASRRTDLTTFLLEYEVQKAKILQYTREDFWDYNKQIAESEQSRALSAFTTWELSFQQIESQDAERKSRVGHFLTVSAFLEPSHIGEYLFRIYRKEAEVTPPWTDIFTSGYDSDEDESSNEEESSEKWRKEKFWEVIERLHRLSLLQSIETMPAASFSLHPLIRDWLQLRRKKSERQKFLREAIRLMSTLLRDSWSEESPLATRQKLLAHLDACTANCRHFKFIRGLGSGDMMDETQLFGDFYESEGRYMEAHNLFKSLLEDNKSFLEEDHPLRVSSMSNLARICRHLGRFKESENLDIQVLEVQKRVLGAEHPDTLTSMASLAATYCRQGRYKKSEGLKIQVLEVQKRALGVEHPDTVITMGNLALTYTELGWWKKAEELEVQALEVQKRVLGEERIDTLVSMSNLASIYWQQGRYKESEALEVQVVEVEKRVLGAEHPDTLLSMGNLAITYTEQGLFKESEELNLQVLEVQKRLLGVEHPDTVITMGNLASTYWQQGCYKESEELEVQVLEVRKRVLGEEHPDTLLSMGNLASIYWEQGCYKEFEALEGQVLEVRKRVLGEGHPQTLISVAKLASTGWDQGRQQEALDTMRSNAESQKKRLGADHPSTLPASKKRRM